MDQTLSSWFILISISFSVSVDCSDMINLALNLGMQSQQPAIWNALQVDCCAASGITCSSLRVTRIQWSNNGLNGTLNGTAIPQSTTFLSLEDNRITGNIPLYFSDELIDLELDGNYMTGDLPPFPSGLLYLYLGWSGSFGNHFYGTLRLNRPLELYINNNWISNVVFQDSTALGRSGNICQLDNNPLLGNPNIANLTSCTKNGLYSANLLPKSMITTETTFLNTIPQNQKITSDSIVFTETRHPDTGYLISASSVIVTTIPKLKKTQSTSSRCSTMIKDVFRILVHTQTLGDLVKILFKIIINATISLYVIYVTPWIRELKSKLLGNKQNKMLVTTQ